GLAKHSGLGFNAAHPPSHNTQPIYHGSVGIGAHTGIGVSLNDAVLFLSEHHSRKVFQVYLVNDAGAGRHDLEIIECSLTPAQKLIALHITLILNFHVPCESLWAAKGVDNDGVVDDQLHRGKWVDAPRVAAKVARRLTHGGQVNYRRYTGEILQQHPSRVGGDIG